jgi:hypothetical protein
MLGNGYLDDTLMLFSTASLMDPSRRSRGIGCRFVQEGLAAGSDEAIASVTVVFAYSDFAKSYCLKLVDD